MYPSQNIDMLCFSLTYGSKNFLSVPIDGTWTLQERDRVKDINVLFVDEHFPDTLWMLIICEKFSVMVSDNCTNLGTGNEWSRQFLVCPFFRIIIVVSPKETMTSKTMKVWKDLMCQMCVCFCEVSLKSNCKAVRSTSFTYSVIGSKHWKYLCSVKSLFYIMVLLFKIIAWLINACKESCFCH